MDIARELRVEAQSTGERRALVLAGEPEHTRTAAIDALEQAGIDNSATTYVGPAASMPVERLPSRQAGRLLGTTRDAVVFDCHDRCEPNAIGRVVGAVDGGGLLLLLAPPLAAWPDRRDEFDASLAVPPFDLDDVTGHFRCRFVSLLRAHRGVAIVDAETGTVEDDGLTDPGPRRAPTDPLPPDAHTFPASVYEACLTADQVDAVHALERLRHPGNAVVLEADRGRGKSSAAGLAAAALAETGLDVLVTAPGYRNTAALFTRAAALLEGRDALARCDDPDSPRRLETQAGVVRYRPPVEAASLPGDPDRLVVDEAAALPVRLLERTLDAPGVAYATTRHGYEGTGRGFAVRFRDRLAESPFDVRGVRLEEPIRYAPGDPVEVWAFRALALDARPAVAQLVADATPEAVSYRELSSAELQADEHLLRATFGLLVLAHYRTEPNDLARLLDAPNVSVHALCFDGWPVSVALVAREGGLPADLRREVYEGAPLRGHMLPDVLMGQLRDEAAGEPVGHRVMRIATHSAVRSRGLGSRLLADIRAECDGDWLGVGFGATPQLVRFWADNGFRTVHVATTRNDRSGEHSALMLAPLSPAGEGLLDRHTDWFLRRVPATFADALSDLDPDVVSEVCRATARSPRLDLTDAEWRVAAGLAHGTAVFETAPRPARRLTFRALCDGSVPSAHEGRLLIRRALQGTDWETTATALDYDATRACKRAFGAAVGRLVDRYGTETARREQERFE
ncbi:MAG: tRNA(Met) cytidine acetyltransferase TmcA [Halovenus sp.]